MTEFNKGLTQITDVPIIARGEAQGFPFNAAELNYVQWGTEKVGVNENNSSATMLLLV